MAELRVADYFARNKATHPVLLDYEKAYDRVDHGWVRICLHEQVWPTTFAGCWEPCWGV